MLPDGSNSDQATPVIANDAGDVFNPESVPRGEDLEAALSIETFGASAEFPLGYQSIRLPDGAEIALAPGTLRLDDPLDVIRQTLSQGVTGLCEGTRVKTPKGEIPVESLSEGDLVETKDHGPCQIRWIARQTFCGRGILAPIEIAPETLGPHGALRLMPEQRVLITDWRADLLFGEPEVLVPARYLLNGTTIRTAESAEMAAYQILLDRHDLIFANGIATESFLPSAHSLMVLSDPARSELLERHPDLRKKPDEFGPAIRPSLQHWEVKYLMG
ncbi:MAG: Hint domain-containing protein [Pseudomonadota bacterium]